MRSLVITKLLFVYWITCSVTASQLSFEYADPHAGESLLLKADAQRDSIDSDSWESWRDVYPEYEPQMVTPSTTNVDFSKMNYEVQSRKVAIANKDSSLKKLPRPSEWKNTLLAAINNNQPRSLTHGKGTKIPMEKPAPSPVQATIIIVPPLSTTNSTRNKVEQNASEQIHHRHEPGDWRNPETRFTDNLPVGPPSNPDSDPNAILPPPSPPKDKFAEIRPNENGVGYPYPQSREVEKPQITVKIIEPKRPISRGADATITIVPFPSTRNRTREKTEPNRNGQVNQRFEPSDWRNPETRFINNSPVRPPSSSNWNPNTILPPPSQTKNKFAEIRPNENGGGYPHPQSREVEKPQITVKIIEPIRPISRGADATITIVPFPPTTNRTREETEPNRNGQVNQRFERVDWRNPKTRFMDNLPVGPPSNPDWDPNAIPPPPSPTKGRFAEIRPNENRGGFSYHQSKKVEKPQITVGIIEPRRPISRGADATITIVPFPPTTNRTREETEPNRNGQVNQRFERGDWRNPETRFTDNLPVGPPSNPDWDPNAILPPPWPTKGKFAEIRPNENGGGYPYPQSKEVEKPQITVKIIEPRRPISRGADATITIVPFPSTRNRTREETEPNRNGQVNQRFERGDWRNPETRFTDNLPVGPPSNPDWDPNAILPPPWPTKGKFAEIRPNENGGGYRYPQSKEVEKPQITVKIIEPRRPISRGADATITIVPFPTTRNRTREETEPNRNGQVNQRFERGDWRNPETRFTDNFPVGPPSNTDWDPNAILPPPWPTEGKFAEIRPNENGGGYPYPQSKEVEKPQITVKIIEPRRPILRGADATITIVPFPSTRNRTREETEPNRNGQVNQGFEPSDWRNPATRFIDNSPVRPPSTPDWDPNAIVPPPFPTKGKFTGFRPNGNEGGYINCYTGDRERSKTVVIVLPPKEPISRGADATITIIPFPTRTNSTQDRTEGYTNEQLYPSSQSGELEKPQITGLPPKKPTPRPVFATIGIVEPALSTNGTRRGIEQQSFRRGSETRTASRRVSRNPPTPAGQDNIVQHRIPSDYTRRLLERNKKAQATLSTSHANEKENHPENEEGTVESQSVVEKIYRIHTPNQSHLKAYPLPTADAKIATRPSLPSDYVKRLIMRRKKNDSREN